MNRTTLTALLGLALAAPAAQAADSVLSYTYVEAHYNSLDIDIVDDLDLSGDGAGVNGSLAFGESDFYGFAGYESVSGDLADVDFELDRLTGGVGYALRIDERLHAIGEIAYVDYRGEASRLQERDDASVDGYRVSVGMRGLMADNIEGHAKLGYTRVEDSGYTLFDGAVADLGFRWHIDRAWSAGLSTELGDGINSFKLGLRLTW
jgi:opacity protein-like surface antigen